MWGGALAPRGSDRPDGIRPTSSPTAFIQAMGVAYRASGRTLPVMDGLAFHPYPDNSSQSPDFPHPRSTSIGLGDYEKLVALLGNGVRRDGPAGLVAADPLRRVRHRVGRARGQGEACTAGTEPATTKPVDERQQAASYDLGLRLAFCQPTVGGILLFHSQDETAFSSWQSGVYYADGTPKASFWAVRDSLDRARGGSIAHCDGLALDVRLTNVRFPGPKRVPERQARHSVPLHARLRVGAPRDAHRRRAPSLPRPRLCPLRANDRRASLTGRRLGAAPVRLQLTVIQAVNPGASATRQSGELRTS